MCFLGMLHVCLVAFLTNYSDDRLEQGYCGSQASPAGKTAGPQMWIGNRLQSV